MQNLDVKKVNALFNNLDKLEGVDREYVIMRLERDWLPDAKEQCDPLGADMEAPSTCITDLRHKS